jgi:TRAP-type C4-dicarboxylate transport system permease small subunit
MKKLKSVSNILTILTGYSLLILSFGIVLEIFLSAVFNFSLQGVDEYGGYVVAILVAFGISQNLLLRGHIRIDFFFDKLNLTVQAYLNLLTYFLFFIFSWFFFFRSLGTLRDSIDYKSLSGTPLETPLWIPQFIWVLGLLFFVITSTIVFLYAIKAFFKNKSLFNQEFGPPSITQKVIKKDYD